MKPKIKVRQISSEPGWRFEVVVEEGGGRTEHRVSMGRDFYKSLETDVEPGKVIEESFRFLLERESKEMIMREFDVTVISSYFPEYKEEMKKRLGESNTEW